MSEDNIQKQTKTLWPVHELLMRTGEILHWNCKKTPERKLTHFSFKLHSLWGPWRAGSTGCSPWSYHWESESSQKGLGGRVSCLTQTDLELPKMKETFFLEKLFRLAHSPFVNMGWRGLWPVLSPATRRCSRWSGFPFGSEALMLSLFILRQSAIYYSKPALFLSNNIIIMTH